MDDGQASEIYYVLSSGISFCSTGEAHIFLDTCRDRYRLIAGLHSAWFSIICNQPDSTRLPREIALLADRLVANGILNRTAINPRQLRQASREGATSALLDGPGPLQQPADIFALIRFSQSALSTYQLRKRPLSEQISEIRYWKKTLSDRKAPVRVDQMTRQFNSLYRIFFATDDACLFHSLMLVRYLILRGVPADLVFGVRLSPFIAHCWAEHQGCVLTDQLENTLNFHPILSV